MPFCPFVRPWGKATWCRRWGELGGRCFLGLRRFLWLFDTMKTHGNLKHHDFFDGFDGYIFHKWCWDIITWDVFCKKLRQVRTGYWCFIICCPVIVVCCRGHHLGGAVLSQPIGPIVVHVGWHVDCPGKLWERFRQRHESLFQRDLAVPPRALGPRPPKRRDQDDGKMTCTICRDAFLVAWFFNGYGKPIGLVKVML